MEVDIQFSDAVIIDILENLPVRSLVRFRCVSKLWCNLIKAPYFINRQFLKRRANDTVLLLRRYIETPRGNNLLYYVSADLDLPDDDDILTFHDMDSEELKEVWPKLSIPFWKEIYLGQNRLYSIEKAKVFGPIDGIICLVCDGCVIFCNPALREFKQTPPCLYTSPKGHYHYHTAQGFGNTSSNDFKVVMIRNVDPGVDFVVYEWRVVVHVYNSSTNLWRKIFDDTGFPKIRHSPCSDVFFNGACHWNAISFRTESIARDIVQSFNVDTEVFAQIDYPKYFMTLVASEPCLVVLNECLSIIWFQEESMEPLEIWVMKEYGVSESWTKQFEIGPYLVSRVLCYWKNDEWLLTETMDGQLASCAVHTNAVKKFEIYGTDYTLCALIYKESLISVNDLIGNSPIT